MAQFWSIAGLLLIVGAAEDDRNSIPRLPESEAPRQPAQRVDNTRDLLAVYGLRSEDLERAIKARDNGPSDVLLRILYRLPQFRPFDLERWSRDRWDSAGLVNQPATQQGYSFLVSGRATDLRKIDVPEGHRLKREFPFFYQTEVSLPDGTPASVFSRSVPSSWASRERLDEPVKTEAIFVGRRGTAADAELVFAARRLQWFPDRADSAVTAGQLQLAKWGFDVALFDDARDRNRRPLQREDRECFYQLLRTVGQAPVDQLRRAAQHPLPIGGLLQRPAGHHGDLFLVDGDVRRVTKVTVSDGETLQRMGFSEYFHIDIFVPLHNQVIRFEGSGRDGDTEARAVPTFANRYPVTLCVSRLPPGLSVGDHPGKRIRCRAAFFRLWAYHSQYVRSIDSQQLQVSPLMLGGEPRIVETAVTQPAWQLYLVGCSAIAVIAAVWWFVWRSSIRDRKSLERLRERYRGSP